jgi:hypothetical protein
LNTDSATTDLPLGSGGKQFVNIGTSGMIGFGIPVGTASVFTQDAYINSSDGSASFSSFVGDSKFKNATGKSNTTTFITDAVNFNTPALTFGGAYGINSTVTFEGTLNSVNFNGKYPQAPGGVFNTTWFGSSGQVQFGQTIVGGVAGGDFPGGFVNIQPPGFPSAGQAVITFGHGSVPGQAAIYSDGTAFFGGEQIMLGTFGMTIGQITQTTPVYPIVMYIDGSASFASNNIVLGANGTLSTSGNVSIGTSTATADLAVSGSVFIGTQKATETTVSAANQLAAWITNCSAKAGNSTLTLTIDKNGNLRCGTTTVAPSGGTTVTVDHYGGNGGASAGGTGAGTASGGNSSPGGAACSGASLSDIRLKTDVAKLGDGLTTIMALDPVSFLYKNAHMNHALTTDSSKQAKTYGFIAQAVEKVLPDMVVHLPLTPEQAKDPNAPKDGYLALHYEQLISPLVKAVQEQQGEITALKSQINELEKTKKVSLTEQ